MVAFLCFELLLFPQPMYVILCLEIASHCPLETKTQ